MKTNVSNATKFNSNKTASFKRGTKSIIKEIYSGRVITKLPKGRVQGEFAFLNLSPISKRNGDDNQFKYIATYFHIGSELDEMLVRDYQAGKDLEVMTGKSAAAKTNNELVQAHLEAKEAMSSKLFYSIFDLNMKAQFHKDFDDQFCVFTKSFNGTTKSRNLSDLIRMFDQIGHNISEEQIDLFYDRVDVLREKVADFRSEEVVTDFNLLDLGKEIVEVFRNINVNTYANDGNVKLFAL